MFKHVLLLSVKLAVTTAHDHTWSGLMLHGQMMMTRSRKYGCRGNHVSQHGGWQAQRSSSGARATSLEAAAAPIHHRRVSACAER